MTLVIQQCNIIDSKFIYVGGRNLEMKLYDVKINNKKYKNFSS